jgi:hypothetical protein
MMEYIDKKGEKIQKGLYKHESYDELFYFTGEYDIEEFPIFEIESTFRKRYSLFIPLIQELSKADNEEINKHLKKLKQHPRKSREKINWLEGKLIA